jgi:hypothetical protein
LKFSVLNALASVVWAVAVSTFVAWVGPTYLPSLGISGWWSALVPALSSSSSSASSAAWSATRSKMARHRTPQKASP